MSSTIESLDLSTGEVEKPSTSLQKNPFFLLKASTRDNKQRLIELYDYAVLHFSDPDALSRARSDLMNPRHRLSTEIRWFPGLSPKRVNELLVLLENEPKTIRDLKGLPIQAHLNLFSAASEILGNALQKDEWAEWILDFALLLDDVDPDDILRDINEDRSISGFSSISSENLVEEELNALRDHYRTVIKDALDKLPSLELVDTVTAIVEVATDNGTNHAPLLINDLVDSYTVECQGFLAEEAKNIELLIDGVRGIANNGEQSVLQKLEKLTKVVKNWDRVAQPIQISMTSRGLAHDMSRDLAYSIRSLGIDLFNKHNMLEACRFLTEQLQDIFAELPEIVEKLEEDSETLDDLEEKKHEYEAQERKRAQDLSYSVEFGAIFKNKLSISHLGVQWNSKMMALEDITRVRWGGTRHSVNGIPTGTSYTILLGNQKDGIRIELRDKNIYSNFIDKLWDAVCYRILGDTIKALKAGAKLRFGDAVIDDSGAEITVHGFFTSKKAYYPWGSLQIWSADGSLYLGAQTDKKAYSSMSYQEVDNVHILETIIRTCFKNHHSKLSGLL